MGAEFDLVKRAFQDMLDRVGVPIWNQFGLSKKCISGAFDMTSDQQLVAMLGKTATKVDMLSEDFDALDLTAGVSKVTFVTGIPEIDAATFTVMNFVRDPNDPTVHFLVLASAQS